MQSFITYWNKFLKEGIDSNTSVPKYYAFDWDDNLMRMPTKILVKDSEGNEIGISTEEFAHTREYINKASEEQPYEHNGYNLVGYAPNPFRNFRTEGDEQFKIDALKAPLVKDSWNAFVECINSGSYFAIITARGHKPITIFEAIKNLIDKNHGGIKKQDLINSLMEREKTIYAEPNLDADYLLSNYEDKILEHIYPVSNEEVASKLGGGSANSPEEAKISALNIFINDMMKINDNQPIKIGFSDDDKRNVEHVTKVMSGEGSIPEEVALSIFYTGPEKDIPKKLTIPKNPATTDDKPPNKQLPSYTESKNRVNRTLKEGIATKMFRTKSYKQK